MVKRAAEARDEAAPSGARERIIAAAYRVLATQGYTSASIKEIARAAGIAPGLVHYYFEKKEDLLLEVVREVCRRFSAEMKAAPLPSDPSEVALDRLSWVRERVKKLPDWYRLLYDLYALALRDDKLRVEVAKMTAEFRANIGEEVDRTLKGFGLDPGLPREAVAGVFLAVTNGLALQSLIDPSFDVDAGHEALTRMTMGFLASAMASQPRSGGSGNNGAD